MSYPTTARVILRDRKYLELNTFHQRAARYRGVMLLDWADYTGDGTAIYSAHTSKKMILNYAGEARQVMPVRQAAAK